MNSIEVDETTRAESQGFQLSPAERVFMLGLNYVPLLHTAIVAFVLGFNWAPLALRLCVGLALLYAAPPLAARMVRTMMSTTNGRIRIGTRAFFGWWALANLQMLFCRFPMLEELLRLVPGLYSVWLRLWGARVGRLTYWGAGLRILDRSFLHVGNDVIFGAAVRLNAHVLTRNECGEMELLLASIVVGDHAVIGGYSLLTAGTEVAAGECTRAFLVSPPFSRWQNGKRISKAEASP